MSIKIEKLVRTTFTGAELQLLIAIITSAKENCVLSTEEITFIEKVCEAYNKIGDEK